jgi:hypothetical protein
MYRREALGQTKLEFPYNVELNPRSKWIIIADLIPWDRIEEEYAKHFPGKEGQVAKSARLAFGALYIQASEGFTDARIREHIMENPHMQYFCGFTSYGTQPPFDASMMVHFRKRIPAEMIMQITEEVFGSEALKLMDAPDEAVLDETEKESSEEDVDESKETAGNW